jgi:hypothetical protein
MTYADLVALEHQDWVASLTGLVSRTSRTTVTRAERDDATPTTVLAGVAQALERGDEELPAAARGHELLPAGRPLTDRPCGPFVSRRPAPAGLSRRSTSDRGGK